MNIQGDRITRQTKVVRLRFKTTNRRPTPTPRGICGHRHQQETVADQIKWIPFCIHNSSCVVTTASRVQTNHQFNISSPSRRSSGYQNGIIDLRFGERGKRGEGCMSNRFKIGQDRLRSSPRVPKKESKKIIEKAEFFQTYSTWVASRGPGKKEERNFVWELA